MTHINNVIPPVEFITRFEKAIGDIRLHRKTFQSAWGKHYAYTISHGNGKSRVVKPRFNWEEYEHFVYQQRHTTTDWGALHALRTLNQRIRQHIHQECQGVVAYRKVVYGK